MGGTYASAASSGDRDHRLVFLATDHEAGETHIDEGAPGPSAGDRTLFADQLRNARGAEVGRLVADCVNVVSPGISRCQITLTLRGGQIETAGVFTDQDFTAGVLTFSVVGGTGRFQGASGELRSAFTSSHDSKITVHLR